MNKESKRIVQAANASLLNIKPKTMAKKKSTMKDSSQEQFDDSIVNMVNKVNDELEASEVDSDEAFEEFKEAIKPEVLTSKVTNKVTNRPQFKDPQRAEHTKAGLINNDNLSKSLKKYLLDNHICSEEDFA